MIAKFNPTGTHVHKGFLKVRIDLYPDVGDKTYPIHHIQVPVIPEGGYQGAVDAEGIPLDQNDYNNWIDNLSKVWQINPCLCHFVKVSTDTALTSLNGIIRDIFNKDTVDQLDDILSKPDTSQVRQVMKPKLGTGKKLSLQANAHEIVGSLNTRFVGLEIEV